MRKKSGPYAKSKPKGPKVEMTDRQRMFAYEYAKDMNATQAAIRAGYSARTANIQGTRLYRKVSVHSLVQRLLAEQHAKLKMSADETLQEIAKLARSNIKRVFGNSGALLSPHDMDDDTAAAVSSIEAQLVFADDGAPPEEIRKIKLWDKVAALRLMAQVHKLIGAEVQVNIGADLADRMAAARKRARGV